MLELLWLIPILPIAGAALNGCLGRNPSKTLVTVINVGAPLFSLLLALGCLWEYAQHVNPDSFQRVYYAWTTARPAPSISMSASCSIHCRR